MDWLKLPISFRDDAARLEAQGRGGDAAVRLYVDSYLWSAQHETDGVLSPPVVKLLAGDVERTALVEAGLWEQLDDGGVRIVRYLAEQKSRAEIEQTRTDARNRQAKARQSRVSHNDVTRESRVSHRTEVEGEVEGELTDREPSTDVDGDTSRARAVSVAQGDEDILTFLVADPQDERTATRG